MNTLRIVHHAQRLTDEAFTLRCKGLPSDKVVALGREQITPDTLASLMGNLADEPTVDRVTALFAFADRIRAFATELLIATTRDAHIGKQAA